jgi:hypothetical protein
MLDQGGHATCVDTWLSRSGNDLSRDDRLRLFRVALDALWVRARTTLGEVTLTAITERVLYNASERFPFLSSLKVEPGRGPQSRELADRLGAIDASELVRGVRFILVEFLTVIGNLTAEILTPELHEELLRTAVPASHGEHDDR